LDVPVHDSSDGRAPTKIPFVASALAALYPDEVIAGILNRQDEDRYWRRFTANQVGSLRRYRNSRFQLPMSARGELVSIRKAAQMPA